MVQAIKVRRLIARQLRRPHFSQVAVTIPKM
jgi:hypothetical protein